MSRCALASAFSLSYLSSRWVYWQADEPDPMGSRLPAYTGSKSYTGCKSTKKESA
jgi:hypothetical protein